MSAVFFPFGISFPHRRDLTAGAAAVWRSWSTGSRSADRQKSPGVYLGRLSRRVQNNSVSAGMAGSVVPNGEESREKRSITWRLTAGWLSEQGSKIPTNTAGNERLRNQGKWEENIGLRNRRTNSLTAFLFQSVITGESFDFVCELMIWFLLLLLLLSRPARLAAVANACLFSRRPCQQNQSFFRLRGLKWALQFYASFK